MEYIRAASRFLSIFAIILLAGALLPAQAAKEFMRQPFGNQVPQPKVTLKEISRHPTDMPDSPNYQRYERGKFHNLQKRQGPMNHKVHLTIKEGVGEIVDGTYMKLWTFDGKIPGPMIRARAGDTVDFYLHNPENSQLPHNIDFHAVTGTGGGSVALNADPGAESHLRAKLTKPGVYVYHGSYADMPTHTEHGLYGLVVVEPEKGLPKVDHEYYLMQGEYYTTLGSANRYQSLTHEGLVNFDYGNANKEQPTFIVFNGRPGSLLGKRALGKYHKKVFKGDTVRIFMGNAGPNLIASHHVIGAIFDKVYQQGSFDSQLYNIQTALVPAGSSAAVEFKTQVPGKYVPVDGSIFRIHKGALGSLYVAGKPEPSIYKPIENNVKPKQKEKAKH